MYVKDHNTKIILVGDAGVGKTSIISRFISCTYDSYCLSTSGASYASKRIEIYEIGKSLILDIWDSTRFISIVKLFIKDAKIIILVYDITRKDSFDNVKNYWYKEIKEHGPQDVVIGIAGNKSDLYDEEVVSEQEGRDFAKSIGAIFSLTSAQNNTGINELIKNLVKKYLEEDSSIDEQNEKKPEPKTERKTKKKFCVLKYLSF